MTGKTMRAEAARSQQDEACVQEDRRSVRSRKMIVEAFFALLQERGADDFTVSDLVQRADVNRSTFYSHFKDRSDLVAYCEAEFLDELAQIESRIGDVKPDELADAVLDFKPLPQLVALFEFLSAHCRVLSVLLGPEGDIAFEHRLLDVVSTTVMHRVLDPKYRGNSSPLVQYYIAFFAHAATGVVWEWLDRGMKESPEDMARILTHIAFLRPGDPIEMDGEIDG